MTVENLGLPADDPSGTPTSTHSAESNASVEPTLLSFGLRRLFVLFTLASCVFALMASLQLAWAIAVGMVVLLIVVHVLSTVVGTRLRDGSTRQIHQQSRGNGGQTAAAHEALAVSPSREPTPASPLHVHGAGTHNILLIAALGAVVGGTIGGIVLAWTILHRISWPGWLVGTMSTAVLGTWLALVVASFWGVTRRTWREAVEHHTTADRRR